MPTHLDWTEIALRLALSVFAGTVIGLDRGQHGRPVGLRTTLLVCLAAAVSMIQTNLLLPTAGKQADSFVTLDLMRLPLGILTGMGFIGAGAILKRGELVLGVTTAATLWYVTVLGLCFGGGQWVLGVVALAIGLVVLKGLKFVEHSLPQLHRAVLTVTVRSGLTTEDDIQTGIARHGFHLASTGARYDHDAQTRVLRCEVRWLAKPSEPPLPALVKELARLPGVLSLDWNLIGIPNAGSE
jgi:putative Mg2+ transporter-C (MgtC) family protein